MLKQRILTALILIPFFIFLVVKLPPTGFCVMTTLFVLWAALEWSTLMGITTFAKKIIFPLVLFAFMLASMWMKIPNVITVATVWWFFTVILILLFPRLSDAWAKGVVVRSLMGGFVLIPCWLAINFLRNATHGIFLLLFLFVLIWGADSGAYFAGRKWGKHKLAPLVSPGKSWEGLAGGLLVSLLLTLLVLKLSHVPSSQWLWIMLLATVTVLFSVVGDLFESMLKRKAGVKDSGHMLPGHGGILDRIDSLTAAAPIFVMGLMLLERMI